MRRKRGEQNVFQNKKRNIHQGAGVSPLGYQSAPTRRLLCENLPARLRYARDQTLRRQFAKREPRNLEPANERSTAAGNLATIHHARRARVPWQLRQPGVIFFRLQLSPQCRILFHSRALAVVAVNPGCLCHKGAESNRFDVIFNRFPTRR